MPLAKDQNMIKAIAPECADQAFNVWVLPRRLRCDGAVSNSHRFDPLGEGLSVCTIIVADQIARCRIPRECLYDLLRQPLSRGVAGHCKPEQLSSTMTHHEKGKQTLESHGWHRAEIS